MALPRVMAGPRDIRTSPASNAVMKFYRAGIVEFLIFLAVSAVLIGLHSRRFDNVLAIVWLLILVAASVRLIYKTWTVRNDPVASHQMFASRWSAVLPAGVLRWMMGETEQRKSGGNPPPPT
jgi:hypothetical protein